MMRPCGRDNRGHRKTKHGVAYIVRDPEGWEVLRVPGSFYPSIDAARAYAQGQAEWSPGPWSVLLEWCDGTEQADKVYGMAAAS